MKTTLATFAAIFAPTVGAAYALDAVMTPANAPAMCGCILDDGQ